MATAVGACGLAAAPVRASASALLDRRGYEMVSLLTKNGIEVGVGIASANGKAANWEAIPGWQTTATLTVVAVAGSGAGTVTSGDGSISCPGACSSVYASGATVTLTAAPVSGSAFAGWSGGGCSGTGSCTVTMGSDQTVTATFNALPPPPPVLPTSPPPPTSSPAPRPSCTLVPAGSRVSALVHTERKHGRTVEVTPSRTLQLTARCDQSAQLTLTGKITWLPKGTKGHPRPRSKTSQLPTTTVSASAGAPRTLVVKLPAAALAPGSRDSVAFTLRAVDANGSSTATAELAHLTLV